MKIRGTGGSERPLASGFVFIAFTVVVVILSLAVISLIADGEDGEDGSTGVSSDLQLGPADPVQKRGLPTVSPGDLARAVQTARAASGIDDSKVGLSLVVWGRGWDRPSQYEGDRAERLWSLSKPIVVLAALQEGVMGRVERPLLDQAITQSSNCATRTLVAELAENDDQQARESDSGTFVFDQVLAEAGIGLEREPQVAIPEDDGCSRGQYPIGVEGEVEPLPLFGTAEWTPVDAARFMRAVADLGFADDGEELLELMAAPKSANEDPGATCDPGRPEPGKWEWGIGSVFEGWNPAYKSGWGGGTQGSGPVIFSQMGLIERGGASYALAVSLRAQDHLGGETGSQCVTIGEIELVESVLQQLEPLLVADRRKRER